ncbi:hypothetical protein MLD38_010673 [Melastoma candidum]|uniref:Uncharacterized protein n=1 Tax=Melastoma candidum TaxID=119954 RepID=A0ACB9R8Y2_9MYRT|nr:hypothetical protein MLD38_010673 [Melastoma candidum]
MAGILGFRECFSYSIPSSDPWLTFALYCSLEDGADTSETLPGDEEISEEDGNTIRVTKGSFFSVKRGNLCQLQKSIASLRGRLFNRGSPIMVQQGSLRLRYRVQRRTVEQYLIQVFLHALESMSPEQNSRRGSVVFHATSGCIVSMSGVEAFWLNREARILQESIERATFPTHPASWEAVEGLQKTKIGDGSDRDVGDCAICFEELSPDLEHVRMPCKHVYHRDCIVTWLKSSHVCPLCRFSLPHD